MNTRSKVSMVVALVAVCVLVYAVGIQMINQLLNKKLLPYETVAEIDHFNGLVYEFMFDSLPTTTATANLAITLEGDNLDAIGACDVDVSGFALKSVEFEKRRDGDRVIAASTIELPTSVLAQPLVIGSLTFASSLENIHVRIRVFGWTEAKNRRLKLPPGT